MEDDWGRGYERCVIYIYVVLCKNESGLTHANGTQNWIAHPSIWPMSPWTACERVCTCVGPTTRLTSPEPKRRGWSTRRQPQKSFSSEKFQRDYRTVTNGEDAWLFSWAELLIILYTVPSRLLYWTKIKTKNKFIQHFKSRYLSKSFANTSMLHT